MDLNQRIEESNQRLEQANQRVEQANQRVEQANQRVEQAKQKEEQAKQKEEQAKQRLDQIEQRLDQVEQSKQREEQAKQREELAKQRLEQLIQQQKLISLKSLYEKGCIPKINGRTRGSLSLKYNEHILKEKEFGILSNIKDQIQFIDDHKKVSNLYQFFNTKLLPHHDPYLYEYDFHISEKMRYLLADIIILTGMGDYIKLKRQNGISGIIDDFYFICIMDQPIGFIVIKYPSYIELRSDRATEECFNFIRLVKHSSSLENVFGIFTNYNSTRILWSVNADNLAKSTTLDQQQIQTTTTTTKTTTTNSDLLQHSNNSLKLELENEKNLKKELYCSKVYDYSNTDLINVLCTALVKMKSCLVDADISNSLKCYQVLTNNTSYWINLARFNLDSETVVLVDLSSNDSFENLVLIQNLGGGGDGYVWKAITEENKIVVIKLFISDNKKNVEKETKVWQNAWGIKTIATKMNNYQCLLMPYLKIANKSDWDNPEFSKLVQSACITFAKAGYKHLDLRRRHVAKHTLPDGKLVVVFIDLSYVENIDKSKFQAIGDEMFEYLKKNQD